MTAPALPIIVAEIEKNDKGEKIRATLDRFKGTTIIDLRVFYPAGDVLKPSRSGISVSVRHLPAIVDALKAALDRAREAGLVGK